MTEPTKTSGNGMELICQDCGEVLTLPTDKATYRITPQCSCGSRRFVVNPTEH